MSGTSFAMFSLTKIRLLLFNFSRLYVCKKLFTETQLGYWFVPTRQVVKKWCTTSRTFTCLSISILVNWAFGEKLLTLAACMSVKNSSQKPSEVIGLCLHARWLKKWCATVLHVHMSQYTDSRLPSYQRKAVNSSGLYVCEKLFTETQWGYWYLPTCQVVKKMVCHCLARPGVSVYRFLSTELSAKSC
jgi:hypothetical protein